MRPSLDVRLQSTITGLGNVVPSILLPSLVAGVYAIVQRGSLVALTSVEVA